MKEQNQVRGYRLVFRGGGGCIYVERGRKKLDGKFGGIKRKV